MFLPQDIKNLVSELLQSLGIPNHWSTVHLPGFFFFSGFFDKTKGKFIHNI